MNRKPARKPFAKKSFGQNFLVDTKYVQKIVDALALTGEDTVVEIGAGRGALTEMLLEKAGKVFAIEFDRDLIPILQQEFGSFPNFELVEADALFLDFTALVPSNKKAKLVANLPYNISTAILQRLIEHRWAFSEMVLMFQREVVHRITAKPGNSDRGFLTLLVELSFEAVKLFDVPGKAFNPPPDVTSSVVRLVPINSGLADEKLFRKLVSQGFMQKRKNLSNNFKATLPNANELMTSIGIDPNRRGETLTLDEWINFADVIAGQSKPAI
ncbi:MAG: 16S rRNA (adenine(1518)-N(6)/adenine(1519)-N(6))-dimethyltransferase RsmA [Pyrinomonadaceae bacterium]